MLMRPTHRYQPHAALWAGTSAWSPADLFTGGVTGAWYQVSDLTSLFEERTGGGTTPASVDGVVGTIRDKSGNTNHLVAPSDAARGILRQSGAEYYIELDATDDTYSCASALTWAYPRFVGVTTQKAANATQIMVIGFYASAISYSGMSNSSSATGIVFGSNRNPSSGVVGTTGTVGSVPINTTKVITSVANTNLITFQSNADTEETNTATFDPTLLSGTPGIEICRVPAYGGRFYGGIFCMNKSMSADDRNSARTWLGNLGGLTL